MGGTKTVRIRNLTAHSRNDPKESIFCMPEKRYLKRQRRAPVGFPKRCSPPREAHQRACSGLGEALRSNMKCGEHESTLLVPSRHSQSYSQILSLSQATME